MARDKYLEPIRFTCPDVDSLQKIIKLMIIQMDDADDENAKYWIKDLEDVSDRMEDLRDSNSTLREWGKEMSLFAQDRESENDELRNRIEELEYEITELKSQLKNSTT